MNEDNITPFGQLEESSSSRPSSKYKNTRRVFAETSDQEASSAAESDEDLEEVDRYWPPPTKESLRLANASTKSKTVSALAFNNAGTRFATGGYDYEVRIWDFELLEAGRPVPICNVQPCEQTVIKNLSYSLDDELVLVVSGSCQAALIAKDGIKRKGEQCPKGDQYITDMTHTKGHVQMLNDGTWSPKEREVFATCSNDATIRLWNLHKLSQQTTVIKVRSMVSGMKAVPSVCRYSRDSLTIATGCNDGSVMMWDTRRKFITTSASIRNAHLKGSEITGLDFSYGHNKLCTRSEDESCKLWDLRQLKAPLAARTGLTTSHSAIDCSFSPDDKLVLTGTSNTKDEPGQVLFLSVDGALETQSSLDVDGASVIRSSWHAKINHIAYTSSNGSVFVAYDKHRSMGGLRPLELAGKQQQQQRRRKLYSATLDPAVSQAPAAITKIITPHALPLFRDDQTSSSFAKIRQDPKRSYKPQMPTGDANQGGHVRAAGSTLSSYVARNLARRPAPTAATGQEPPEPKARKRDEAAAAAAAAATTKGKE